MTVLLSLFQKKTESALTGFPDPVRGRIKVKCSLGVLYKRDWRRLKWCPFGFQRFCVKWHKIELSYHYPGLCECCAWLTCSSQILFYVFLPRVVHFGNSLTLVGNRSNSCENAGLWNARFRFHHQKICQLCRFDSFEASQVANGHDFLNGFLV